MITSSYIKLLVSWEDFWQYYRWWCQSILNWCSCRRKYFVIEINYILNDNKLSVRQKFLMSSYVLNNTSLPSISGIMWDLEISTSIHEVEVFLIGVVSFLYYKINKFICISSSLVSLLFLTLHHYFSQFFWATHFSEQ